MFESVAKAMWILLSGAFVFGAWSATLEVRSQNHSDSIAELKSNQTILTVDYQENQRKLIDVLGRMDERLKNIERRR